MRQSERTELDQDQEFGLQSKGGAGRSVQASGIGVIIPDIGAVKAEAISIVAFMHGRPGRA